jgi:cation diffusion facilitator family transporter
MQIFDKMKIIKPEKIGYIGGITGIIVNLFLFIAKYYVGVLTGSIAIIADAWDTLADIVTSILSIVGLKLSNRKPSKNHPFGYGRIEQISALVIAFILGIVGYEIGRDSIGRFLNHQVVVYNSTAMIITASSILFKELLAQFNFWGFRRTNLLTLKASAWNYRGDALTSIIVLSGIFLQKYIPMIDAYLGMIISLMIFYSVFEVAKDIVNRMIGEKVPEKLIDQVEELSKKHYKCSLELHNFKLHNYGHHTELTFHIKVEKTTSIFDAHEIATNIETELKDKLNISTTIHIEPKK